jgi:fused signal recognition particle receptor
MMPDLLSKIDRGIKRSRDSWFGKVANLFSRPRIEDETWDELEELLIAADVGVATTEKLIKRVKQRVKEEKLIESSQVQSALKEEMVSMLSFDNKTNNITGADGLQIVLVVGVNGSGKTTSIAKLAQDFKNKGKQVVLAAADTFRAAAIEQLKQWGDRIGVPVVTHQAGADPGAVVFDAIQAAQNRAAQIVIVDTAGRLHTKFNLMEELKKIKRVASKYNAPQEVLLVLDATTGQNGLLQARHFTEAVGVNGIYLTKLDGTARGGIVLAICDELKIPLVYIGTGEHLDDMVPFDAKAFVEAIFAS